MYLVLEAVTDVWICAVIVSGLARGQPGGVWCPCRVGWNLLGAGSPAGRCGVARLSGMRVEGPVRVRREQVSAERFQKISGPLGCHPWPGLYQHWAPVAQPKPQIPAQFLKRSLQDSNLRPAA